MKACTCPNCGKPTIPFWQKQFLGPAGSITCAACGARLGVPWLRSLAFICCGTLLPILGGVAALAIFAPPSFPGGVVLLFVAGAVAAALPLLWLGERHLRLVVK